MTTNTPFEQAKEIVLSSIEWARTSVTLWMKDTIVPNPQTIYIVILNPRNKTCLLAEQKQNILPKDPIEHPYKTNIHFYFIIFAPDACYEGYLYVIPPENNFHISLLFQLRGEDLKKREELFSKVK